MPKPAMIAFRTTDCGSEQVPRGHSPIAVESDQLRDDTRHRGADNLLVKRGQKQSQQETRDGSGQLAASEVVEPGPIDA